MLVYHFKGRLTNVENKYDTMFGIMHNMVGELKSIKKEIAMCALGSSACAPFMCMRTQSSNQTENNNDSNDSNDNHDEYDDEDSASESSEEYDNEPTYHSINEYDQSFIKIVVSDNEPELESVEPEPIEFSEPQIIELSSTEPETKVITIELSDNLEEIPEEITEEKFHDQLGCLPPENWKQIPGGEYFQMCEYWSGNITSYYARCNGKFYTFMTEAWKKPAEVLAILNG
jgi:hypothetical protein